MIIFFITFVLPYLHIIYYQIQIMNHEESENIQSNDSVLEQLNLIYIEMQKQPNISQQSLRTYVDLYVRRHSLSQDFFSALCQHCIIQKMFGSQTKHIPSVALLQIFNLLLANTSQQNSLIFIFSQSILHEYLFQRFDLFSEGVQAVQYYVQLLKTIILKISSQGNNSLIKLFCNNRYPSFPLLSVAITLATAYNQQDLVRVTACQCVLQLIALINQKQVGRGYLTDVQMSVFFYELTVRMSEQMNEEGHLKYLSDLIYALRNNPTSLSLLFSAFTNNVLLPLLDNLPQILLNLRKLSEYIDEHGKFPKEKFARTKHVFLNIISAFYFSKFTNSTYMASIKLLNFTKTPQPNLLKYYQKRGQKIGSYLLQFDSKQQSQDEKMALYENWVDFNFSNQQIQKIKDGKIRKSGFFSNLFTKTDPVQEYIRKALTSIGLNYDQLRFPLFKLSVSLNMKTCIYIVQQAITLRQLRGEVIDRQKQEAHLSDYKGKFDLSEKMCTQVLLMVKKLQQHEISMADKIEKCPPQIEFQYGFLLRFRSHLLHTLSDYLLIVQKDLSLRAIALIRQTITQLKIFPLIDQKMRKKLVWKLEQLQQEINDLAFANDFKKLIGYVLDNKQQQFLKLFDQNNEPTSPSPKSTVQFKTFKYEFIRKIIDPQLQSISDFVNNKWCQSLSKQQVEDYTFRYLYKQKGSIVIKPTKKGILLFLKPSQLEQWIVRIKEDDPKINAKTINCLQFAQLAYSIQMQDKDEAFKLRNSIQRIRSFREERVTKLIVQYFETTYNKIRDNVLRRIK